MANRRTFLKSAGAAGAVGLSGLAGCIGDIGGDQAYGNGTVTFLMSPTEEQETMRAQYQPVEERLNDHIDDADAEVQFAADYSATLESLDSGTAEVAETGPFAAALGADTGKAEIILQRQAYGGWTYGSYLITTPDSDIESVEDLEGKTIAFADALSASGSLYPLSLLADAGLSVPDSPGNDRGADFSATWSTHEQALEALMNDQADAAGVGAFITTNDDNEFRDDLKEVASRDGIPRAPILVSPDLSDDEKEQIITAFTEAPDEIYYGEDGEADTDDDLWFDGVRERGEDTYQPVIDAANNLGYGEDIFQNSTTTEQ
ncbi:phosphate/phosphite/phosphonate ABC transporter substrate-binding protein [Halorussus litoreus]|uniref:phosphate/phosphite/phosphonate ABC transporter substrate-binding protein n=1 Tax=Halorussus litoreus TaxID=1710536 RepID=UPI000E24D20F|nr:phosphate/phosphite/phosphonate ABC transporter substrate-binding protein [Halorussus litoreus]